VNSASAKNQTFKNLLFCGGLVDADIADISQQSEVYLVRIIFLVVFHQFVKRFVVVAVKSKRSVILLLLNTLTLINHLWENLVSCTTNTARKVIPTSRHTRVKQVFQFGATGFRKHDRKYVPN